MHTILGDGETKVGKSSTTRAVVEAMPRDRLVRVADAGVFYRQLTAATLDLLQVEDGSSVGAAHLDTAVQKTIASGVVYEGRDWGDLERPAVARLVSEVGARSQAEGRRWYQQTALRAIKDGIDVLVLNGRNPRDRLAEAETGIPAASVGVCLELIIKCDPEVAGLRAAIALYGPNPTAEQVTAQTALVIKRRETDRNREDTPYIERPCSIISAPGVSIASVLEASWDAPCGDAPRPISFDTSYVPIALMNQHVQELARTALSLVE